MSRPINRRWDQETLLVAWLAACVSLVAFLYYLRHGDLLLYGDAVAHINIARRVFDPRTPGLLQLGTVWLPLPHLLMIPFLLSDGMWQSGVGGSIPSMIAYILGGVGLFRLVRGALSAHTEPDIPARIAAWIAVVIFAANPNLIYLQSTAMTEPLSLALIIWAIVHFTEFVADKKARSLTKCGLCLAAVCLTRYDGWFLAVLICMFVCIIALWTRRDGLPVPQGIIKFLLLAAAAPVLWITYNAVIYKNPLEFANGPYSAKAIERKTSVPGQPPHPGSDNLPVAASYFLKAAELNMTETQSWHRLWVVLLFLGAGLSFLLDRKLWPVLLLLFPLPFYMLSVAYSGIPIFLPPWWPFSIYNARYGIELLPAFAVFAALLGYFAANLLPQRNTKVAVSCGLLIFVALSYTAVWRAKPISYREAWVNSRTRIGLERELGNTFRDFPQRSTILMYLGEHVGALQRASIPLKRVVNEGNHRTWKQPYDADGLWEQTLAHPEQHVDFVVAFDGDPVAKAMEQQKLPSIAVIHTIGQARAVVYLARPGQP